MHPITVGAAEIRRVEEMTLDLPIGVLGVDAALVEASRPWLSPHFLDEQDRWRFTFQCWILQVHGRIVVVDPCNGNGRAHPNPMFANLDIPFLERFRAAGVRPEEVDCVFCTHMHHDHCGWNTELRGGRFVPTFPNARYIFVRDEYERWDPTRPGYRVIDYNVGVYERSIQPVVEAGLAQIVGADHRILEGLTVEPAYGHTTGHTMLHLTSGRDEAYFTGDVFHHPLQLIDPAGPFGDAEDPAQSVASRRRVAQLSLERDALIIPAHLPAPHAGKLRRAAGSVFFEALAARA
jgi:glyoxylase-like metal-dependent hydrolase (beta-lactamase superfamily II)